MSRKGPTRIPTFGSRIPLPGQIPPPADTTVRIIDRGPVEPPREPTKLDVGRRVRVSERDGALRYIGAVHFAAGLWCGVEVAKGTGKNDGTVRGVRYFACAKQCGLMVPVSKVLLVEDSEDSSGPHSMLFGISEDSNKTIIRSRTFDKIEPPEDYDSNNLTFNKSKDFGRTYNYIQQDVEDRRQSNLNETYNPKRNFVLENLVEYGSPCFNTTKTIQHSTPIVGSHDIDTHEEINKRDSLEFEESLGILTPDQMIDVSGLVGSRTPSSENIRLLPHDELSPKLESSIKEFSLGLIDEHILSALTMTTMNLPLDPHDNDKTLTRIEQTPSPEELPLDPTPVIDSKVEQKKPPNSFITSITSITSLDTGYQGDGEMSRPASRGADNSPLTRRPQPRPPPRRNDPMTDSDFYTESDADNHEEHPLRGDRKAQVIDGTLYGVDPQAAADIYANNRENMDSSGIFTDIERTDELSSADNEINHVELSPSDSSTKTISDDSQGNVNLIANKTPTNEPTDKCEQTPPITPSSNTTATSSPASTRSPRHLPKGKDDPKKYKMPKRNVASKVKAMMEPNNKENEKRAAPKKPAGRWDAVMNKISKSPQDVKSLKDVKSKVFTSISNNLQRNNDNNTKISNAAQKSPNNKTRRIRTRAATNTNTNKNTGSINSSLSDLSGASPAKLSGQDLEDSPVSLYLVQQVWANNNLLRSRTSPEVSASTPANGRNRTTLVQSVLEGTTKSGDYKRVPPGGRASAPCGAEGAAPPLVGASPVQRGFGAGRTGRSSQHNRLPSMNRVSD